MFATNPTLAYVAIENSQADMRTRAAVSHDDRDMRFLEALPDCPNPFICF